MNMMNMIMEKNFTCLYYKHEAYLDRVYIQQINDIDFEIWWIWLWKRILPDYTTNMKLTWTGSTFNKLMRDYKNVWGITIGNEGLLDF